MNKAIAFFAFLALLVPPLWGQTPLNLTLVSDDVNEGTRTFENSVQQEIESLLGNRYDISFSVVRVTGVDQDISSFLDEVYNSETDGVIGLGLLACDLIAKRSTHSKPTILTFILDNELQEIPITEEGTSGIPNVAYIQSPFDINRDLETLYEFVPYENLAIITADGLSDGDFQTYFARALSFCNADFEEVSVEGVSTAEAVLAKIPAEAEAAYLLPIFGELPPGEIAKILTGLADRGIPVLSLLASPALEMGAYAAYDTDGNLQRIPRRAAINLLKILDGQAPESLSVTMDHFTENLVINMKTVKESGLYPSWETLSKGILINVNEVVNTDRAISLESAITEGLERNLGLQIANKEVQIVGQDVLLAQSNYLPQLEASASAVAIDENSVRQSFGTRGYLNTTATASLSQLILSEPALANITIQKLLLESERQVKRQNELDVIIDVANAYLGVLQTIALVDLRNENVKVTRKNYDLAQAKEQVGYGGTSDVYRWESELALDNIDLNSTQAQLAQARFNLNALLNRPIKEEFQIGDIDLNDSILLVMDSRLFPLINNPGDLEIFADFLVQEAFQNLPELKQLEATQAAQERSLLSQKRAFYLPTVALSGEYNYPIDVSGFPEGVTPIEVKPTYSVAVAAQFPIFQGFTRRRQKEQTEIGVYQLEDQMANLRNNLELLVRSNIETAGASFSNLELSQGAATAAQRNFEIAQNSYQQGILNITSLIDAQNAALSAKINATNAAYTFMSDFLEVERSIGYYHFLALPQEKDAFFQRFISFITQSETE